MSYPWKHRVRMAIGAAAASLTLLGGAAYSPAGASEAGFKPDAPLAKLVPEKYREKGVLVIATQPDFEPANFTPIGESAIKGYNVDLMEAMAAKLGLPVQWDKVPFDQILIGMQSKKFDAAIAGMTDRKNRQEKVDFIDYQLAGSVFMIAKGNPKGITGAVNGGCGITIGDVKGSDAQRLVDLMAAACTAEGKEPTKLVSYPNSSDKNLALTSGRIDAMIWPDLAVSVLMRETGDVLDSLPIEFEPKVYLGMTFNKEESALRDGFVAALKAIHEDGTYDEILADWKVEVIKLEDYGVNLAKD
ncbi:transporter substrate-binding domain-containing protein [Aminobacter sp. SR38]|uniref:transporter substrate-binding domain-containing protein n=1 Tax=Aminobacter sp. SR38 TaxID=2774562 RepID=UPI001780FCFD|nr:transporter substrate-binding domain-containing protein [Aminobacter sp. SR38]QOF69441.1 transporter substrate-binding domain-containing protein [Aminobacter sp. SR38]